MKSSDEMSQFVSHAGGRQHSHGEKGRLHCVKVDVSMHADTAKSSFAHGRERLPRSSCGGFES